MPKNKKSTERIIRKRNFPTDFDHDGQKEGRTVYRGESTNRFYSKAAWEAQQKSKVTA